MYLLDEAKSKTINGAAARSTRLLGRIDFRKFLMPGFLFRIPAGFDQSVD